MLLLYAPLATVPENKYKLKDERQMEKELIDFARWYMFQSVITSPEDMVSRYLSLKSINSEASSEAQSVSDNEAKKKVCDSNSPEHMILIPRYYSNDPYDQSEE